MTNRDHVSTETLADHAEGLLGESEAGQVQAHLDECEDCRSEALLLVSLQEILRADDPGPMPAEYATRIDAALAELIAAEPPRRLHPEAVPLLNAPAESEAGGAKVIDLASRRAVMMTGLRRVSTVAAGVVLLIGGAALGVQTIGKHTDLVTPPPSAHDAAQPVYTSVPLAPKDAKPGKNGIRIGKDGTIYLKNGKVLLTDGTVIVPGAHKSDPPVVVSPKHKSPGGATTIVPKNTPPKSQTGTQPAKTPPPATPAAQPATPAAQAATPVAKPTTKASGDGNQQVGVTSVPGKGSKPSQAGKDTYVTQSGSEYTQDNFANKVMDLMTQASQGSSSPGTYTSTSSGTAQPDPTTSPTAGPTTGPSPSYSPSMYPQNLAVSYRRFDAPPAPPAAPGRGPADPEVKNRVQRCATQLGTTALAGDEGVWLGHKATIVVTPTPDNPNQVIGYVFYGNCTKYAPATADTAQWEQRVDKPAPDANRQSAPVKRVGGTSPTDGARSESFER